MSVDIAADEKLHQAFVKFDRNKSGGLDQGQFAKFFRPFLAQALKQREQGGEAA